MRYGRSAVRRLALSLLLSGTLLGASQAAIACDSHGTEDNYFLAYVDFRGMSEADQRKAEQEAIDKYHAKKLAEARAAFISRFNLYGEKGAVASY